MMRVTTMPGPPPSEHQSSGTVSPVLCQVYFPSPLPNRHTQSCKYTQRGSVRYTGGSGTVRYDLGYDRAVRFEAEL
jgi:hypothetical protein